MKPQSAAAIIQEKSLLLFDLDGTLVDSAPDLCRALNLTLSDFNLQPVTLQQVRQWVGQGAAHLCQRVLACQYGAQHGTEQGSQHDTEDSLLQQSFLERFLCYYQRDVCIDSRLYPSVRTVLEAAQSKQKILACITNKPYQPAVLLLQQLDIFEYFDCVIGGDSLPQRKPSPEPLLYVMHKYNVAPVRTVMIGDSRHDVMAAQAAGVDCIAVSYGYNHGEPISTSAPLVVIDDLSQLITTATPIQQ